MRKVNQVLRKNKRELDRSLNLLTPLKKKTESLVKKAAKLGDMKSAKVYAKELVNIQKQYNKLYTLRTRIDSINMAVNEQWQMNKLTKSLATSTSVMKDVNLLVHIGVMTNAVQELSKELMKAGIINEMMDDMVDLEMDEELEDEANIEVDKIIEDLTADKLSLIQNSETLTSLEPEEQEQEQAQEPIQMHHENEEDQAALYEMTERLKALQE